MTSTGDRIAVAPKIKEEFVDSQQDAGGYIEGTAIHAQHLVQKMLPTRCLPSRSPTMPSMPCYPDSSNA